MEPTRLKSGRERICVVRNAICAMSVGVMSWLSNAFTDSCIVALEVLDSCYTAGWDAINSVTQSHCRFYQCIT